MEREVRFIATAVKHLPANHTYNKTKDSSVKEVASANIIVCSMKSWAHF